MYRQVTLDGIGLGEADHHAQRQAAGAGRDEGAADYLEHYNHGRGFVLIGHSQGSFVLEIGDRQRDRPQSLDSQATAVGDPHRRQRRREGQHRRWRRLHAHPGLPLETQLGCVIAFSTFDQPVPPNSLFGRPARSRARRSRQDAEVLCTNPANLAGGSGLVDSISPSAPFAPNNPLAAGIKLLGIAFPSPSTVYWSTKGAYSAKCVDSNGAHVLMISPRHGAPLPKPSPTPNGGSICSTRTSRSGT